MTLLLFIGSALAQDCDGKALEKELAATSPAATAQGFVTLAECDPARARKAAARTFEKVLSGEDGNAAAVAAIEVGAGDVARSWIDGLQSDEKSRTIKVLGQACGESDAVAEFLVETQEAVGQDFWSERWYRGLAECRKPGIQSLLTAEIDDPSDDRNRFMGVLEVYARNLGKDALPRLGALARELEDPHETSLVINAFADAAGVGSLEGQDPEAAAAAIATLLEIAPELPPAGVEFARVTLQSLGAPAESDALAGVRYEGLRFEDGQLHYAVVAVETWTCKKGTTLTVHTGEVIDGGQRWPDQLEGPVTEATAAAWDFGPGKKCTAEGDTEFFLPRAPAGDAAAMEDFYVQTLEDLARRDPDKVNQVSHDPLTLP